MKRDFAALTAEARCWDPSVDQDWYASGRLPDCILQNRLELIGLCEFIEAQAVRSYLEIGIWTGRLLSLLQSLFHFEKIAACDVGVALQSGHGLHLPPQTLLCPLSSHSIEFMAWRSQLGLIDMVLIDGDHSYDGVRRDFEINTRYPHRFLVFHDIHNPEPQAEGVGRFWRELQGHKLEIFRPDPLLRARMGIGIWSRQFF